MLAAISLLPLALPGVWTIDAAGEHRLREQERVLLDLARALALASAVDSELDGTVATLSGRARSPSLQDGDLRAFYGFATPQSQAHPGHAVRIAHDAPGALATAAGFAPDAAILDTGLPDLDGYALAAALRARARGRADTKPASRADLRRAPAPDLAPDLTSTPAA